MSIPSIAVVFEGPREVTVREIQLPEPGDEDVVIDNIYTGISVGTESWILRGERPVDTRFPCVPGYQQTGLVTHVGSAVQGISVGDLVNAFHSKLPENLDCGWGGHVSKSVTDYRSVIKIPEGVSLKDASLAKLFAVGYHGVQQTEIGQGDLVVILGLGLIGQGYAQIARTHQATVVGGDLVHNRLDLARAYSCDVAVLSAELDNVIRNIKEDGADIVVDTTGKTELLDWCVKAARQGAKIVWQAWYPGRVSFDFHPAHIKRVKMIFPCSWDGEDRILQMLADKQLNIEPLITHVFDAYDAPKAYEVLLSDPQDFLGITLKWRDEEIVRARFKREKLRKSLQLAGTS